MTAPLETLLGPSLLSADGKTVGTTSALRPKTAVGLYFSAHWCPPCRRFTPQLAEQYKKLAKELELPFEIVFVSSDRDEATYDDEKFSKATILSNIYYRLQKPGKNKFTLTIRNYGA